MKGPIADRYHILAAGETVKEMLSAYSIDTSFQCLPGDDEIDMLDELYDEIAKPKASYHKDMDEVASAVKDILHDNRDEVSYFCIVFKNNKLFALYTHDSAKTYEVN